MDHLILWLKFYLTGRTQIVRLDNALSTKIVQSVSGVPQDSHLSPVLFSRNINDGLS